jgi:hypothetical protein
MSNRPQLQPAAKYSGHSHRQQFENAWNRRYRTMREPPAVDVSAERKLSSVPSSGDLHRRTLAEDAARQPKSGSDWPIRLSLRRI